MKFKNQTMKTHPKILFIFVLTLLFLQPAISQVNSSDSWNNNSKKDLKLEKGRTDSLKATTVGYPVIGFFKDTLFLVYNKLGSFSAKERADAISVRIHKLAGIINFNDTTLKILEAETNTDIVHVETVIMSITENDAKYTDLTKTELAEKYKQIISKKLIEYKSEISFSTLLKEIISALLVLLIGGLAIFYNRKLFRWTVTKIEEQEGKWINGLTIKTYTLFDAKSQVKALLFANVVLKWFVFILLVYIALPILFGIFPWTQNLADTLFNYVADPIKTIVKSLWNYIPNLITIVVILFVFRYILKGLAFLKAEIETEKLVINGFYPDWANPTYQIIKVLIYAFMLIIIFPYLPGSDSPVFRGVSVFLGVLFTFGSSGSLSNIIAGLILTYMRAFKIGDRVKIGEITGDIIEKSMLVTRIRTIKNEIISVPNSNIMSSHTINYSSDSVDNGLILHTTVTIGYDVPWKNIHQALIDAAMRTEHLLHDPKPFILQTSLDDFFVSYQINAYTREPNKQALIYSQLHQNIQDCCNEAGIEIMSPHYRAARDGNMTTIPTNYLDKDYEAPAFKVKNNGDK